MIQKLFCKQLVADKWEWGWGEEWAGTSELADSLYPLLYIKWINNKELQYNTGNYIQYPVINHNGTEYETYITGSLCCTTEISTTL